MNYEKTCRTQAEAALRSRPGSAKSLSSHAGVWIGWARRVLIVGSLVGIAACGPATLPPGDTIVDASEAQNRAVHRFNVSLDQALGGGPDAPEREGLPQPVRAGIGNFASNLSQPSYVLNNLLQFRIGDAAQNTLRFALNTTVGVVGLFDPASALGVPAAQTDFGETLHIYGVGEGDYHVLPVIGPSTTRDSVGRVVDFALNPLRHYAGPENFPYVAGAQLAGRVVDRQENAAAINDLLYRSEDSYVALRSLYLQNRRFELRGDGDEALFDPYAHADDLGEATATDPLIDPYFDPYFDPYAQ